MEKVLYIAPRFHTNQYYATKSLVDNQIQVKYLSKLSHKIENYDVVIPTLLGKNIITRVMEKISGKPSKNDKGLPPFCKTYKEIKKFKPDCAIIRGFGLYSVASFFIIKLVGHDTETILYTQERMVGHKKKGIFKVLDKFCLQPIKNALVSCEITPLSGMKTDMVGNEILGGDVCYDLLLTDDLREYVQEELFDRPLRRCLQEPFSIKKTKGSGYRVYHVPLVIDWMADDGYAADNGDEIRIIMVSEFKKRKRIIETIDILNNIVDTGLSVHLTIIGNAGRLHTKHHLDEVISSIHDKGLESSVTIITDIPHEDVLKEYKKNHIFLLAAIQESAGYSVLEAMANGTAVITSSDVGLQECIIDGFNGFVFEKNDLQGLEDLLIRLCGDRDLLRSLGENNKKVIEDLYSPQLYHDYLRYVYDEIKR